MNEEYTETMAQLAGVWRLISSEFRVTGGEVIYPLGENAQGQVMISQSGYMSGQLMRPGRAEYASAQPQSGTDDEIRQAAEGYIAYYGPFELDLEQQKVITHVEGSLFPNWVGHDQERFFHLTAEHLTLSTPPFAFGDQEFTGVLVWERLSG